MVEVEPLNEKEIAYFGRPIFWKIKTDSNNCITIRKVRTDIPIEEVREMCKLVYAQGKADEKHNQDSYVFNKWIEDNL